MGSRIRWLWLLGLVLPTACGEVGADVSFLDDRAGLLDWRAGRRIRAGHERLLRDLDVHLQLTILAEPAADLDRTALALFERQALGRPTRGAKGVLLLVDPVGGQVRLEIGYDLEGMFPDALVSRIEREQMAPFFRAGRVADGVEATVELLVAAALDAVDRAAYDPTSRPPPLAHGAGGAGARLGVQIGSGDAPTAQASGVDWAGPQPTPRAAFDTYLEVLARRIQDPDLGLYTPASRRMLARRVRTDAQQRSELRTLRGLARELEVIEQGGRAVVRGPVSERRVPPYFLVRGPEGWQLDLAAMSQLVGFDHLNRWRLRRRDHAYAFAFAADGDSS